MKYYGIERQTLLVTLIPILVMAVLLENYFVYARFADLEGALMERSQMMAQQIASSSEYAVFSGNTVLLQQNVDDGLSEQDVNKLVVLDADAKPLMGGKRGGAGQYETLSAKANISTPVYQDDDVLILYEPIVVTQIKLDFPDPEARSQHAVNKPLGSVIIEISKHRLNWHKHEILMFSLVISLLIFILALMLALWAARRIARPIVSMSEVIHSFGEGNLDTRILAQPKVLELNELTKGFNRMAQNLQHQQEILESRVAERTAALAASEFESRTLLENSPDTIARYDRNLRRIYVNRAFGALAEGGMAALLGKKPSECPGGSNSETYEAKVKEVFATGENAHFELKWPGMDGKEICSHIRLIAERDSAGNIISVLGVGRDITELNNSRISLQQANDELGFHNSIFRNLAEGITLVRASDGVVVFTNPQFDRMLGYEQGELLGKHVSTLNAHNGTSPQAIAAAILHHLERAGKWNGDVQLLRKNGNTFWCLANISKFDHPEFGDVWLSLHEDITARKQVEESLLITASVFENSQEAILITDENNEIMDANPAFTRITGFSREEVLGRDPKLLSSGRQDKVFYAEMWQSLEQKKAWRGELWNRRKSGEVYAGLLSISVICDEWGRVWRYVGVFSDISHIKEHEAELSRVAHYDTLTGIPNRLLLADRMKQAIAQTARENNMMAVCYLDLDGFKPVNDSMGHERGDEVLIEVARRIESTIRGGDTVARLGGDEFVILLLGLEQRDECVATLERLLSVIAQPITTNNISSRVSASIGVSIYPLDSENPETLLRYADETMYLAKKSGRNRFCTYGQISGINKI